MPQSWSRAASARSRMPATWITGVSSGVLTNEDAGEGMADIPLLSKLLRPKLLHDRQRIARGESPHLAARVDGMGDPAVGSEDERRGLDVGKAVVHTGVAADRARRGVRIQAVEHGVLQPESLHRFPGLLLAIG